MFSVREQLTVQTSQRKQLLMAALHAPIPVLSLSQNRTIVRAIHEHIAPHGFKIGGILELTPFSSDQLTLALKVLEPRPQVVLVGRGYSEDETSIARQVFGNYMGDVGIEKGTVIKITNEVFNEVGKDAWSVCMAWLATSPYWDPLWLRKSVLFTFTGTFILFLVGLILIWYYANRYDGIPLTLTTNHYAWTYGPTAIFTVVVSLWGRVNYCIMVNQPWHELRCGPQEASKTVLLDYIWPLQVTSFFVAVKHRHIAVATGILIFALLKVVMVISTALFVLENSLLSQDIHIRLLSKFDAEKYWDSGGPYSIAGVPAWNYWSLRKQYRGVTAPLELSTAVTSYSIISKIPEGAGEVSLLVHVFKVNVTCEPATVGWPQSGPAKSFNLTVSLPTGGIGESRTIADESRYIFVAAESDLSLISSTSGELATGIFNITIRRAAAVSCDLEYSINQGIARGPAFDTSKIDSLQITEKIQDQIGNLTGMDILEMVLFSGKFANMNTDADSVSLVSHFTPGFVALVADSTNITTNTFDPLLQSTSLKTRMEETLDGLSHQIVREYLLLPDNTTASGSVDYTEQRLYIRPAALWTTVGLLSIISCLVIVVATYIGRKAAPRSPEILATVAYIISRSPALDVLLGESGAIRQNEIRKELANYDFVAGQDRAGMPRVEVVTPTRQETPPRPPKPPIWLFRRSKSTKPKYAKDSANLQRKKDKGWVPYSGRVHAITLTIILPIITIAVLEILWNFSKNDENFVTVSSDSSAAAYAIRYGSTTTVLIISTLFNTLDFAIATMTPFGALAAGDANPERTILFTIAGDIPPVALYKVIRHMHLGAALSLTASTLGGLLTIVASGLWFSTVTAISRGVTVELQSDWNVDFTGQNSPNSDTMRLLGELEHGSPDDATLIWGDVVLPRIGNPQPSMSSDLKETFDSGSLQYNIAVPAIRPFLECSAVVQPNISIIEGPKDSDDYYLTLDVTTTFLLPAGCGSSSSTNPPGTFVLSSRCVVYDPNNALWIGRSYDLRDSSYRPPSEDCPSLGAIFGTYEHVGSQLHYNMTALTCIQRLQWVEANATYYSSNSSLLFTPNLTIHVHLNSAPPQNIMDSQSGSSSFSIYVDRASENLDDAGDSDNTNSFNAFFSHVVFGPSGTSREKLLGRENVRTLVSAINTFYQKLMVHVIDREWRSGVGGGNVTYPIPDDKAAGGVMNVSVLRLKLNETSKIILQGFLGTMVLLGGISWWCIDMRVLPRNPYPIASGMALFAGSRLIGASSQAHNGRVEQEQRMRIKRKPLVVFKGRRFRLGWWEHLIDTADDDSEIDSLFQAPSSTVARRFGIDIEDDSRAVSLTVSKKRGFFTRRWLK
ncbi:hypothetical protein GQX73_g8536 [Xylaria multiplex]|uniref:Uncharacterized protein n=1 Tax=Xylaria multiplex TaxID=323545 RepID=A0A7C8IJ92_9PEZI|nr:hypothetical protein GQX73_g8536 [Xylaria multiplex]